MPKDDTTQAKVTCPVCGSESPPGSRRCDHCYSSLDALEGNPSTEGQASSSSSDSDSLEELKQIPGVGEAKAEILHEAGYRSIKDLQKASVEELAAVKGIGEKLAAKIVEGVQRMAGTPDASLASWLAGMEDDLSGWLSNEENTRPAATAVNKEAPRDDPLARWLAGEVEDVSAWLDETPTPPQAGGEEFGPEELLEREAELVQLRETLREKLRQLDTGELDIQGTIEELAKARAEIETLRRSMRQLEEELENVKRGSIAVIKFIKSQQGGEADQETLADKLASEMAQREMLELKLMELEEVVSTLKEKLERGLQELPPDIQELKRRELAISQREAELEAMKKQLLAKEEALTRGVLADPALVQRAKEAEERAHELALKVQDLEARLAEAELALKQKDELMKVKGASGKELDQEVLKKIEDVQRLERTLVVREQEIQRLKEELRIREDELSKLKEPLRYKEEEILRREEDLMYRERLLQEEMKKAEQMKAELASQDELTLKKRLEELQAQITAKEEEIRAKEKYLAAKEEELRLREQGIISEEIEKREQERLLEVKMEKVKTGTPRLDDLLLGGIPFGSNVLIYGPPFTGKEVIVNAFIAEGLKKGVPALWVLTEKTPKEIREEMSFMLSGYEEYEKLGLVRYVDAYSRSMGDETEDPYTEYIESPTDYESIQKAIETAAKQFKEKHEYYRMGFRSISTLIAYLDPGTAFRFLSPVVGRRKRDRAVAMYTIEKGVHGEQEIQMIGSLMDGMIEFKVENLNTFLAVKGICEVQSRAFIRYSATKTGVTIGSFSLDHIR